MTSLRTQGLTDADAVTAVGRLHVDKHDGTDPAYLATWARHEGYRVCEGWMSMDTVRHYGQDGVPVILLATLHGGGHWVVSRGVTRQTIYLHDPAVGRVKMPVAEFEAVWHDGNRYGAKFRQWGVVVVV